MKKTRLQIAAKGFCLLRRAAFRGICRRRFFAEFVFYRIFVMIRNNTTYFKNENPDSMIRISRFFLPFLCCLTAPALAGTQTRWEVVPDSTAIVWNVREGDSHRDHIEMSGLRISAVLRYGVGADGSFRFERSIVWPMLRTIPNNTHGSLMRRFAWDVPLMLSVNENCLQQEKVRRIVLDGTMTVESDWTAVKGSLSLTRVLFPSVDEAAFCEKYILKNTGEKPLYVEIPRARSVIRTAPAKGVEGSYELVAEICGDTALMLAPRAEVAFGAFFSGRRSGDEALALNADAECAKRRALVAEWQRNLVLDTPDPVIDAMFAFAKIRAAESIYDTKGGLMHGPGGERFYAAIWANDQAEYINPFFPFLGYDRGNRSALCSFGYFARYMNPDYRPIPSSIIAEGTDIWNGAGDRGDAAMIAYGAARYALARGDAAEAAEVWPLVEWCLEYCRRRLTGDGVVASDSDELEGRFPAGDANLCTSSLYYDALLSAAMLGRELHKPARQLAAYERQAAALRKNIDRHFGGMVEGFDTYRYYTGNDRLRAWICIPLTVGIDERKEATVEALFSPKLWTENGLLTRSGDKTFWDRSTLYALRGAEPRGDAGIEKEREVSENLPRLFHRDVEQVETTVSHRFDAVVVHADRGRQPGVFPEEFAAVHAVEDVVGDLQHPARQAVLEVENVEARDAFDAAAVFRIVVHHLFVAEDPEGFDLRKPCGEQPAELFGRVFAHVPRVAGERHRGVGGRHDEPSPGAQHPVYFAHELRIAFDMLDHLERDHAVETSVGEVQRRDHCLPELDVGAVEQLRRRGVLVDGDEPPRPGRRYLDAVAGSGSDFEHVARDARRGGVVGQQRALENEIVRGFRRNALRGVNLRHVSGF